MIDVADSVDLGILKTLPTQERLAYWIQEREAIRQRKEQGEQQPWTKDPILHRYRFCNVRRMDDKVSRWLLDNWYGPYKNHHNMLVATTLARHYNLPFTLGAITPLVFKKGAPDLGAVGQVVRALKKAGHKVFNGAYMVRGIETVDKTEMVLERVCKPLVENPPDINTSSMENSLAVLMPYWGFSSFMGGQIVADLRWAIKGKWKDKGCWAPLGPGSKRGMNRLHNRPKKSPISQEKFLEELTAVIEWCLSRLPKTITDRLEAMDYQNCLCEFDKYERTLWGEGKPKQLYRGAAQ